MSDVLVLNRSFTAIQVISWRRAISLVFLDHAHVVDQEYNTYNFENWKDMAEEIVRNPAGYIHTPSFRMVIPEVIALKTFNGIPKAEVKFTRRNLYEHYHHRCAYCGRKFSTSDLNLDHVIPRSRGGKTDWTNVVTSCIPCNLKKGSRTPKEAHLKLHVTPSKPKWTGPAAIVFRPPFRIKASWQRFVDNVYWNSELKKD